MKLVLKTFEEMVKDNPDVAKNEDKIKSLIRQNEGLTFEGDLGRDKSVSIVDLSGKKVNIFINFFKPALQKKLDKIMDE